MVLTARPCLCTVSNVELGGLLQKIITVLGRGRHKRPDRVFLARGAPKETASCGLLLGLLASALALIPEGAAAQDPGPAESFNATFEVTGGAHRMFQGGTEHPTLLIAAWSLKGASAHEVSVTFQTEDIFGHPVPGPDPLKILLPDDGQRIGRSIAFQPGLGYFSIKANFQSGKAALSRWTDLGIVYPPFKGPRPDSLFGSNTSGLKQGVDLNFLQTIGMKVERAHFAPPVQAQHPYWPLEFPRGAAVPLDFSKLDMNWEQTKSHDLWVLPVVGYSLAGAGTLDRTDLAKRLGVYGPPGDPGRFIASWERILRRYPEITTYEFWNEPWIFEWTWAATPAIYRQLQKDWCAMALRVNPHNAILAGSSTMFIRDNIEPYPECWRGLLSGLTHHPYTRSVSEESFRGGDNQRSIDDVVLTTRQMGLAQAFLTEGGTNFQSGRPWDKEKFNNLENASKIVQYYVTAALCGAFMGNAQWGIGYGPDWTRSNTAFAVMTHFLEDRVPLADIWPQEELLWGGIFADARFATEAVKALPRAAELQTRWKVEVPREHMRADATKVAVLWSLTGRSKTELDKDGQLVISDPSGLRAFDLSGREIPPVKGELVIPLSGVPVYIVTETLSVIDFRDRIVAGAFRRVTPLNLYALSLTRGASEKQLLSVRIQNQLNRPIKGTLSLSLGQGSGLPPAGFQIQAGSLAEVALEWPGVTPNPENRYPITLSVRLDAEADSQLLDVVRDQEIAVAKFEKHTITLTGSPKDLEGMTPVLVDSQAVEQAPDATRHLLNPALEHSKGGGREAGPGRIKARVATAYDDDNVYLMAQVSEDQFHCSAGQPATAGQKDKEVILPYQQGMPEGLHYITYCGNVLQFSFGFRDRVPGVGRQMSDPWAWKGCFYDSDYSFVAHVSTQGDQLIRIWGPDGSRQDGYQTQAVTGVGPVPGGKVKITRDESQKLSLYEIAIPRRELTLFDPRSGRCRFGFILYNSEQTAGGFLAWSDAAGVFDYWQSAGSFPPSWTGRLPCQTFFGIEQ